MQTKEQLAALIVNKLDTDTEFCEQVYNSGEPCNEALYTFVTDEQRKQYTYEQWDDIMEHVWEAIVNR